MDAPERWAVSGKRVTFVGDAMAAVVQGVEEVRILIGELPVVVGGWRLCADWPVHTGPPQIWMC